MSNREILIVASVLALLRGEISVRGVAERFGVTEAQVRRWKDVFEIAGMLALSEVICGKRGRVTARKRRRKPRRRAREVEPTTGSYTTTTLECTTTLDLD